MTSRRVVALAALALVGCSSDNPQDFSNPEGPAARKIDQLADPVFLTGYAVGALVLLVIVVIVVKFRRRDDDPELPSQVHGNTRLEIGWTMIPALILAVISVFTVATIFELADQPEDAIEVEVIGQQWWWEYRYELDGNTENGPEIITANELVIPAGEPVNLTITSRDVIHSYWVPRLNGKRDAVPGREHDLTIEADEPGTYLGQCTEYCGLSHANMRNVARALSPSDWETWLEEQQEPAVAPVEPLATAGLELFEQQCTSCHLVDGVNDDEYEGAAQVSGAAPNLTHLMSRGTFAGSILDLHVGGDPSAPLNRPALEAWLRDPPGVKPMAPDDERGMPDLNLTEEQIDQLVAYLETLE